MLLCQTILGACSGKPQAFLLHYLSFPRNEEQIFSPGSLNWIRTFPRKCKKKHLCPQPTSEDHLVSATVPWVILPAWFCLALVTTSPEKITLCQSYENSQRKICLQWGSEHLFTQCYFMGSFLLPLWQYCHPLSLCFVFWNRHQGFYFICH